MKDKVKLLYIVMAASVALIALSLSSCMSLVETMFPAQSSNHQRVQRGHSAEDYYNRAIANYRGGNYDLANENLAEAIRLSPNSPQSYNLRAWIYAYHLKRNFDMAINDATQAIRLSSNNGSYYDTRGWAYLGKGEYDKATDDFFMALQLDPSIDGTREGLRIIREAQAAIEIDWNEFE